MSAPSPPSALDAHLGYWLRFVSNHVSLGFSQKLAAREVTLAEWVLLRAVDALMTLPFIVFAVAVTGIIRPRVQTASQPGRRHGDHASHQRPHHESAGRAAALLLLRRGAHVVSR